MPSAAAAAAEHLILARSEGNFGKPPDQRPEGWSPACSACIVVADGVLHDVPKTFDDAQRVEDTRSAMAARRRVGQPRRPQTVPSNRVHRGRVLVVLAITGEARRMGQRR